MIGMNFWAFLVLLVAGVIAAVVIHYVLRYRLLEGFDGFLGKCIAGWVGAWIGSPVLGGPGGDVHGQPFGLVAELGPMPGFDQRDRKPAQRSTTADTEDLPLAGREDGPALGRRCPAHDRTKLSQDYGLPGSLDAESRFGSEQSSCSTGGGVE